MKKTLLSATILLLAAMMIAAPSLSPKVAAQEGTVLKVWHYESPNGAMGIA